MKYRKELKQGVEDVPPRSVLRAHFDHQATEVTEVTERAYVGDGADHPEQLATSRSDAAAIQ